MPFAIYMLGLAVFAQGTSEFMLSGLVPDIARELGVSVAAAGSLTSAFAVGMVIGAPLMAILSLRWPPRRSLLALLTAFLLVHVAGALTTSYAVLLATRIVAALANAGFLAVALATAGRMAGPEAKGRATSVLLGGTTVACVAGVPGGALLGELWGWRAAFWAVALVSAPVLLAILRSVPEDREDEEKHRPRALTELRALRSGRLLVLLLLGALVNGATFCAFTYLAPFVTDVAGIGSSWVPGFLALFGIGSSLGVALAGRFADARPGRLLAVGCPLLPLGWAALGLLSDSAPAVIVLVLVQGALSFAVGATLISQVLYAASGAPTLGGASATAAFNVGAALGPWAGGLALATPLGHAAPPWGSAALTLLAVTVLTARTAYRARAHRPAGSVQPGAAGQTAEERPQPSH
ncbi:Cmx/CmrA family chloramphenicol efflux MFS transporter [Streptomyces sp. HNM0574]|uniref:Cmx/CmrA family chloramphenicol efflux MFS transporter n=1 Tax=Streptomyces sp. HNM0574 TaxID=2714954 RepID=UPI00146A7803|nr:Cmx/CmrA family chloramphenicol efflux MFS transporter [Streptomyces sp. HNM0574]NLU70066.1 MFS transporter [Streptomyces sp. HNM0574]